MKAIEPSRLGDRWLVLSLLITAGGFLLVLLLHAWVSPRPIVAVWEAEAG